jgi:DNA repair photolyase
MNINFVNVKSYITKTKVPAGDFVINPYIGCPHKCVYCYGEFMKRFTNHREEWGDFVDVKLSDKSINIKALSGKKIIIGSVTDAYNQCESKYKITRKILEQLINADSQITILTKSALVTRDTDLFERMKSVEIAFSMNTLDDSFRKDTEPFASPVNKRIAALKRLKESGIKTGVFLSPVFPEITDFKAIIKAAEKYADSFWFEKLNLYPPSAKKILNYIKTRRPDLIPLYEEIYIKKDSPYWERLEKEIIRHCEINKIDHIMYFYHKKIRKK